jgi:hypothetical protein
MRLSGRVAGRNGLGKVSVFAETRTTQSRQASPSNILPCCDDDASLVATERTEMDDLRAAQRDHRADDRVSILGLESADTD